MMAVDRTSRVISALLNRMGEQGDMHIRVSRQTLAVLRRAIGVPYREDPDDFREVDAVALELLVIAARQAHNSNRSTER